MPRKGVLLVNLGSPDSPEAADVKVYLREFLMDKYVIDMPFLLRKLIVEGFILPKRPQKSAEAYQAIWSEQGSPLIVTSESVHRQVKERLDIPLALAMRYGNPSIQSGLQSLIEDENVDDILLIPLYAVYSMATVKSVEEKTRKVLKSFSKDVKLTVLPPFYSEETYLDALAASAKKSLEWDYDHLLFSFHGLPERHLKKVDPTGGHCLAVEDCCAKSSPAHATCYRHQVLHIANELVKRLKIPEGKYSVAFQSRLGVDSWLQPSTANELVRLAEEGTKKLAVYCPAFVSDCLETLEEIAIQGKETFLEAGGEELRHIPCMNDHPAWIDTLSEFCKRW